MGLPEDVNVIAWGLSLERPTMIHYDIKNIRNLFGATVPLSSTKNNKTPYIIPKDEEEKTSDDWVNLTEDGGIQKRIMQEGYGDKPE